MLDELDEAYELFSQASAFAGDFVFGGKPDKWMRVVNSFELKVLMYCAAKDAEIELPPVATVFGAVKLLDVERGQFPVGLLFASRSDVSFQPVSQVQYVHAGFLDACGDAQRA